MLEFATKCPQPASLWKTISAETISPSQGYSADQIRFILFIYISLSTDFTIAKERSNTLLKDISIINIIYRDLSAQLKSTYNIDFSPSDFQKLKPIEDMTDVVLLNNLDIPSIFIRQLLYGKDISPSLTLIEDLFHINNTQTYIDHLVVDISAAPVYITMYQLNTSEPFQYFKQFTIDSSLPAVYITCKEDIDIYMKDTLADTIYNSKVGMLSIGTQLVIPEFTLTVHASKTADADKIKADMKWKNSASTPSTELSWDDVRVGTKLRCTQKVGDRTVGGTYEVTGIATNAIWVSNDNKVSSNTASSVSRLPEYFTIEEL